MPGSSKILDLMDNLLIYFVGYISINDIHDLAFAPDGTLWAIGNGGLVHWDLSTDTYARHLIHARSIAVAPDGTLWLAADYGVCHFDGASCKNYATDGLIHSEVRVIEVAPDRVVWVGTARFQPTQAGDMQ